jgi:hypothetical protein
VKLGSLGQGHQGKEVIYHEIGEPTNLSIPFSTLVTTLLLVSLTTLSSLGMVLEGFMDEWENPPGFRGGQYFRLVVHAFLDPHDKRKRLAREQMIYPSVETLHTQTAFMRGETKN